MVVIWDDIITIFGLWFHVCLGLGVLTSTGYHLHDKQDDGKSFMPQESSGTDRYSGKSHVRLFTGL
jgi:hypothetical protein